MRKILPTAAQVLEAIREAGARMRRRNQDELDRRALLSIITGSVMYYVRQRERREEIERALKREKAREYNRTYKERKRIKAKLAAKGRPLSPIEAEYAALTPEQRRERQRAVIEERRQKQCEAVMAELIHPVLSPVTPQEVIDRRPVCYAPHCMHCSRRLNSSGEHVCIHSECIIPTMQERRERYAKDLARCTADPEGQPIYNPMGHVADETLAKQPTVRERYEYYTRPFSRVEFEAEELPRYDPNLDALFPETGGFIDRADTVIEGRTGGHDRHQRNCAAVARGKAKAALRRSKT